MFSGATSKYKPVVLPADVGVKNTLPPPGPISPMTQEDPSLQDAFKLSTVSRYTNFESDAGVPNSTLKEEEERVETVIPDVPIGDTNVLSLLMMTTTEVREVSYTDSGVVEVSL